MGSKIKQNYPSSFYKARVIFVRIYTEFLKISHECVWPIYCRFKIESLGLKVQNQTCIYSQCDI